MIIGIIAIAKNFAIGKEGKLPWQYAADLKFFKQTTTGHAVVMGRNTFDSIGKPLPNRLNFVVSRNPAGKNLSNLIYIGSKEQLLTIAPYLNCDIFIIGGAAIYEEFADLIEKWIVTEIPGSIEDADTFIDQDFLKGFEIKDSIEIDGGLKVGIFERAR